MVPGGVAIQSLYRAPVPGLSKASTAEQMELELDALEKVEVRDDRRTYIIIGGVVVAMYFGGGAIGRGIERLSKRQRERDRLREIELTGMYISTDAVP
eukprot:12321923-Prorocentrum_lima.AAC.1